MMEQVHGISEKYRKYNPLIGAKYKSSLLEQKIIAIALASSDRIRRENGYLVQEFRGSELQRVLGVKGHAFYEQLDMVGNEMTRRVFGVRDPKNEEFDYIALITRASYKGGTFRIEWNNHLEHWLFELKNNFTVLNLPMTLQFKSVYGFRLYEVLRSICWPAEDFEAGKEFSKNYSLAELKLTLGVINAGADNVQRVLKREKHPDYEKAVSVSKEQVLSTWGNLRAKAIEPAVREINEITDLSLTYEAHGSGRGGKIRDVTFRMKKKEDVVLPKTQVSQDDAFDFAVDEMGLKARDARAVCEAAGYDMEKLEKALDCLTESGENVENPTGFLIKAIKEGWEPKPVQREGYLKVV